MLNASREKKNKGKLIYLAFQRLWIKFQSPDVLGTEQFSAFGMNCELVRVVAASVSSNRLRWDSRNIPVRTQSMNLSIEETQFSNYTSMWYIWNVFGKNMFLEEQDETSSRQERIFHRLQWEYKATTKSYSRTAPRICGT